MISRGEFMKICPTCQFQNDDQTKYCRKCGAIVQAPLMVSPVPPQTVICPRCRSANPFGTRFCGNCAQPLTQDAARSQQYAQPMPPPAQPKKSSSNGCVTAAIVVGGILTLIILVPVLLIGIGTYIQNAQSATNPSNTNKNITQDVAVNEEILEVSIEDLLAEFEDNDLAAGKKYNGRTVKLTGVVCGTGENVLNQTYVTIGETDSSFNNVYCTFTLEKEINKAAELHDGDTVTIIGKFENGVMNLEMTDCYFWKK